MKRIILTAALLTAATGAHAADWPTDRDFYEGRWLLVQSDRVDSKGRVYDTETYLEGMRWFDRQTFEDGSTRIEFGDVECDDGGKFVEQDGTVTAFRDLSPTSLGRLQITVACGW